MSDHVYKTVEVTGSSPDVISDAIRTAVAKASQTLRNLEWFEVENIRGMISDLLFPSQFPRRRKLERGVAAFVNRNPCTHSRKTRL